MRPGDLVALHGGDPGFRYGYVLASSGHRDTRTSEEGEDALRRQVEAEGDRVSDFQHCLWFSHRKDWFETCGCDEIEMWCEDGNGSALRRVLCVRVLLGDKEDR